MDGACQSKLGGDDRRPGLAFRVGQSAALIGQIGQEPRYGRGHPAELVYGTALRIVGQFTAKRRQLRRCAGPPQRGSHRRRAGRSSGHQLADPPRRAGSVTTRGLVSGQVSLAGGLGQTFTQHGRELCQDINCLSGVGIC